MKYNELDDSAKEKAREWMRSGVDEDNYWSESVIEDWKQILEFLGFYDVDIFWSGFWSQGDGACFVGKWRDFYVEYNKLVEYLGAEKAEEYGAFFHKMRVFKDMGATETHFVKLIHHSNYCHEHSISYDFDMPVGEFSVEGFEEDFKEACKYLMRQIYRQLEQEYEYQTSDEALEECILANDYDFNEEGEVE